MVTEYVVVFAMPKWYDFEQDSWRPGGTDQPTGGGKVLIVHKNRPAYLAGRINLTGGKIDPGETPEQAAVRELKEETGLDTLPHLGPEVHGVVYGNNSIIYHVRLWVDSEMPIVPQPGETEVVEWVGWDSLLLDPRLMPNLKVSIPLMRSAADGVAGWVIEDRTSSLGNEFHEVFLTLPGDTVRYRCRIQSGSPRVDYTVLRGKERNGEVE